MGSISSRTHEMEDQYLSKSMTWKFGNTGSISIKNMKWISESFGTMRRRNFETKKQRNEETKKRRHEETKKPRNQETKKPRHKETKKL